MAGIEDILGAGKAAEKLLNVVQQSVGTLYGDWIAPIAEARKTKMLSAAETETEHAKIISQTETLLDADSLARRAGKRLIVQEIRRQNNIERVVSLAAEHLKNDEVSDIPVDIDWSSRFFESVKDVSDEKVQDLWSKILAGEIKTPGTFSLRTLEILKNISKSEATLFTEKACPLILNGDEIIKLNNQSDLTVYKLSFGEILQLRDAGLILPGDSTYREHKDSDGHVLVLNGKTAGVTVTNNNGIKQIPAYVLSCAGRELYKIQEIETNTKYINDLDIYLKSIGFEDIDENKQLQLSPDPTKE